MSKKEFIRIEKGPLSHKDKIIDRFKKIFKSSKKNKKKAEGPTHKGEDKAVYDTKESGSNSYASNNKKMIKALKRDA